MNSQLSLLSKGLVCVLALVGGTAAFAAPAEASHGSYSYRGQCYGFPGENQMIAALASLDVAAAAPCIQTRIHALTHTRREIMTAHRLMVCPHSKRELLRALGPLGVFQGTGDLCFLDRASSHIVQAMETARLVHMPRPMPQPSVYALHGAHHGVHQAAHDGVYRGVPDRHYGFDRRLQPAPVVYERHHYVAPVPVIARPAGITIGGRKFAFNIRF